MSGYQDSRGGGGYGSGYQHQGSGGYQQGSGGYQQQGGGGGSYNQSSGYGGGGGGGFGGGGAYGGGESHVGNLSWNTDSTSLRNNFSQLGQVTDAVVVLDRETGRSRGFGFVTFSSPTEADAACQQMNGASLDGRNVRVNIAQDRQ